MRAWENVRLEEKVCVCVSVSTWVCVCIWMGVHVCLDGCACVHLVVHVCVCDCICAKVGESLTELNQGSIRFNKNFHIFPRSR